MIIEYDSKYDEQIKDLLVQLQQHLADMDKEGYNIVGNDYRDKYFAKTMEEVKKCNGKILLFKDNEKILIAVFGYNESAIKFYEKNGYHIRMIDMIED